MTRRVLTSIVLGVVITTFSFVATYIAYSNGDSSSGRILYWQGYWLAHSIPAPNIGTPEHPIYEGTPIHIVAFFMGLPIGVVVYSVAAFVVLSLIQRRKVSQRQE